VYKMMLKLDSIFLLTIRRKALRKGVWFKVLNSAERAILNLVPRCMERPRSSKLIDILAKIIVKINDALKNNISDLISQVGEPLARKLSCIAHKWGHKTATEWAADSGFWKYLTLAATNGPSLTRAHYGPQRNAFSMGLRCASTNERR
jgi:hypothetical protein